MTMLVFLVGPWIFPISTTVLDVTGHATVNQTTGFKCLEHIMDNAKSSFEILFAFACLFMQAWVPDFPSACFIRPSATQPLG